jgi:energy-coupling factor transport system substrate-specific component
MGAGTNIWLAVMGSDGIFTVVDRIISFVISRLVIKVIPDRTLIKFGCGANYIKKAAKPASDAPAEK